MSTATSTTPIQRAVSYREGELRFAAIAARTGAAWLDSGGMDQGRYDIICPVRSAWDLHRALPKSDLRIVPDGSHSPMEDGMIHELVLGGEDFKSLF